MTRPVLVALQLLVAILLLAIWHVGSTVPIGGLYFMPKFFFSTPADVIARIWKMFATGVVWRHLGITLLETAPWASGSPASRASPPCSIRS